MLGRVNNAPPRRRWALTVGSVAGIKIRLHASMLILVWIAFALAQDDPGGLTGAIAWVATIFGCVLLHELSHSLVARRLNVRVEEIELLPIGGLSKMDRIPDKPADEAAIALAGPLLSIVLGLGVLAATALATHRFPSPALAGGPFGARIGWFNLAIGGFNLLPAMPLDGGRILRAQFERTEGPLRATHHAARIARAFAFGMIVFGLLTGALGIVVIGLFVQVVSRAEETTAEIHAQLDGVTVGRFMVHRPLVVSDHETAGAVASHLMETSQRVFPVVSDDGSYRGLLGTVQLQAAADGDRVDTLMTQAPAVHASTSVETSGLLGDFDTLAVVDDNEAVIGLVRRDDVVFALQRAVARHS